MIIICAMCWQPSPVYGPAKVCRLCRPAYAKAQKAAGEARRYAANKPAVFERVKAWQAAHPDKKRQYDRTSYQRRKGTTA